LIAGANTPTCLKTLDLIRQWGGNAESIVLVHGDKVPAPYAGLLNSIMARAYDYEVLAPYVNGVSLPFHVSATTVSTAFAVAEREKIGGKEFLTALILGDDLASRIAAASNFSFDLGWDPSGMESMFGAAAVAGRLKRLNANQLLNAFGIGLNQLGGTQQNNLDGTHCIQLIQGTASYNGIFSVELAKRGFLGPKDALLSKYGFFSLYGKSHNAEILEKDLGQKFYADSTFKRYPCCRGTHAAIDCALEIASKNEINIKDIADITIDINPAKRGDFVAQPFKIVEFPQSIAAFNLYYTVANAIMRKSVKLEHFSTLAITDKELGDLIKKVRITTNIPLEKKQAAAVKVTLKSGKEYSAFTDMPRGEPTADPLTEKELKEKYRSNVAFSKTVSSENAAKAIQLLEKLEDVEDITAVIKLLVIR
jgi:2-methylcitrate dehydratase PrpD